MQRYQGYSGYKHTFVATLGGQPQIVTFTLDLLLKRQQRIIHFSISGGRRLMTFLSFSAALLYFETPDELLHLYTPEHVKERVDASGAMHIAPEDERRLIEVPFARAAQPFLALMLNRSPSDTILTQREQHKAEEQEHCKAVVDALADKPHQVLRVMAQGLHPHEVADILHLKASTVSHYATEIYQECRNAWNVPENIRVDYRFVHAKFADYFYDK